MPQLYKDLNRCGTYYQMRKMGRKSIAQKILEGLPEQDIYDQAYIVVYDFIGRPPHHRFYSSLHRITELTGNGGGLTQQSVYKTMSLKAALAVHNLAVREGAQVQLYEVTETSPEKLLEKLVKLEEEAQ